MADEKPKKYRKYNACITGGIVRLEYRDDYYDEDLSELSKEVTEVLTEHLKKKGHPFEDVLVSLQIECVEDYDEEKVKAEIEKMKENTKKWKAELQEEMKKNAGDTPIPKNS